MLHLGPTSATVRIRHWSQLKELTFTCLSKRKEKKNWFLKIFSHDLSVAFLFSSFSLKKIKNQLANLLTLPKQLPITISQKQIGVKLNRPHLFSWTYFFTLQYVIKYSLRRGEKNPWQKWLQAVSTFSVTCTQNWQLPGVLSLMPKTLWWCQNEVWGKECMLQ